VYAYSAAEASMLDSENLFPRVMRLTHQLVCASPIQRTRERHCMNSPRLNSLLRGRRHFTNQEGHAEFNFTLYTHNTIPGTSALLRVKNESSKIEYALRSIHNVFDEIVVVDNGSQDDTLAKIRTFKDRQDRNDTIKIYSYPYSLARFGREHSSTPEDSVHSAVYFSNWGLSHCTRKYVCKWDGDMVLRREARESFVALLTNIQSCRLTCWELAGQTVYFTHKGDHYLALGEVNSEIELIPYGLNQRFMKHHHWEYLSNQSKLPVHPFDRVAFYELKCVDEEEFSHWSTLEWPSFRKKREWSNFELIRQNQITAERFEKLPPYFLETETAGDPLR
jgi:glycosyltransferase involved in cell wall biosynthesis